MKKIKLGIFGPSGRMGQDILKQLKSFNEFDLVSLCEKKNHINIDKEINKVKRGIVPINVEAIKLSTCN